MIVFRAISIAVATLFINCAVQAAEPAVPFPDCPLTGVMPDYQADTQPQWRNWDSVTFHVLDGDSAQEINPHGTVCIQGYSEKPGKTEGSILEISMNFKELFQQQGAEIKWDKPDVVVAHLQKDGKEYWIQESASRDDGYRIQEVVVQPFKRTLEPPSGNDYRLLGHMPGYVGQTPTKKNYDEYSFPVEGKSAVAVRGMLYIVNYNEPATKPKLSTTVPEILENYREALKDLHAEFLYESLEQLSARLDDQGKTIWIYVNGGKVAVVEEKPFQMTIQPPTADAMKDKLDKEGHIALYINFDFAKATLKPDAQPIITQVVELLKRNPDLKLSIDGHTDDIGKHDYNLKLSEDRAASVVAAITAASIDGARLKSAGYGPDKPIASNDTDDGRAKNRRVELVKM